LRGGRYRLQEIQERQDWLSGVFEAVWIGKDAHRAGSQVVICEVVLPENTSVMTQTILRTATMALATIGRHPHIPALWDAFSDQGRSFFVFEPIEGETLMARMRYSGRALPEQEVIEFCLQLTDVLELLAQQSSQLVHGLIRPEHIILSRNSFQYILTNFSVVLAGGATQYIAGMERSRLSSYTAPEFVRGVVDVRTDMYSLIATAYHAVTGSAPSSISGSIPQAQRINPNVSSAFDAILSKGLRTVPNQRYQRPSELR
jgi:serine/threonine protein kinase